MSIFTGKGSGDPGHDLSCPGDHIDVVKSDADTYSPPFRYLVVGGAGTVALRMRTGRIANYTAVAGQRIEGQFTQVMSTGTGATNMVAQW